MIFADFRCAGQGPPREHPGQLPPDERLVIGDSAAAPREMDAQIEGCADPIAAHWNGERFFRPDVAFARSRERALLGIVYQPVPVHRDSVYLALQSQGVR